jgi:hypothetical protein
LPRTETILASSSLMLSSRPAEAREPIEGSHSIGAPEGLFSEECAP